MRICRPDIGWEVTVKIVARFLVRLVERGAQICVFPWETVREEILAVAPRLGCAQNVIICVFWADIFSRSYLQLRNQYPKVSIARGAPRVEIVRI